MSDDVTCYTVERTTTEKLQSTLNDFAPDANDAWGRKIEQIQHVGGRDWVVIVSHKGTAELRMSLALPA